MREASIIDLAGDWAVAVTAAGGAWRTIVSVPPPRLVQVRGERYAALAAFNPAAWGGWQKGTPLSGVRACECTTKHALRPASLSVATADGAPCARGRDWEADLEWGSVGRLPGGRIGEGAPVVVSYDYAPPRLDAVVRDASGRVSLREGTPQIATPHPPALGAGEARLANVFVEGQLDRLDADHLFPVLETAYPEPAPAGEAAAARLLPCALRRLHEGGELRILAWGDSVTDASYLAAGDRWQAQFAARLRMRYPRARIELLTEAWGGRTTRAYLAEPPASPHNYREKVLAARPDLVVMEFVNDASLPPEALEPLYTGLRHDFRDIGAEWIICTPHYIRPDWMGLTRQRGIDDDPRPYVQWLRDFAPRHGVPLAEASPRYGRLWRQGVPYNTLMTNNINHPDARGMKLYADSLMALFPA